MTSSVSLNREHQHNSPTREQRALVTGGSRGIGAAIVGRLAREGANVALTYVSRPDDAKKTTAAAEALGVRALAIQADSTDAPAVVAAVERTAREFGGLDILATRPLMRSLAKQVLKKATPLYRTSVRSGVCPHDVHTKSRKPICPARWPEQAGQTIWWQRSQAKPWSCSIFGKLAPSAGAAPG